MKGRPAGGDVATYRITPAVGVVTVDAAPYRDPAPYLTEIV
jgi:hypothetical protein